MWIGKTNPASTSYCFDAEPHFQYFREYKSRPEAKGDLTETMSLQGSFFMCTREKWFDLNICDEAFGSWGSQGIETAVKTWLSGGRVIVNHKTWYAHMFRTKGGDFGFPYPISGKQIQGAKRHARDLFFKNQWPMQKYPLSWLVEKFWPIPGWTDEDLAKLKSGTTYSYPKPTSSPEPIREERQEAPVPPVAVKAGHARKGIVYYTDNRIEPELAKKVQARLLETGLPIVSVSLKLLDFGNNIVFPGERSYLTMFRQILTGIEAMETDIIFLCEHDVLYTPEHFAFTPEKDDLFYYNTHNWQVRQADGFALYWDCRKVSQVCAFRTLMLKHYRERVRRVEAEGFSRRMGFEPGTHGRPERVDDYKCADFRTEIPNLDIRHKFNLTASRWRQDQFRNKPKNWKESHVNKLTGWEDLKL